MAKWIAAEKARAGLRHEVLCSSVTRRIKARIAQSKRARAGSLAIIDPPHMAETCVLRVFGLQISCRLSLVLRWFCFVSLSSFLFLLKPRSPSFNRSSIRMRPDSPTCVRSYLSVFFVPLSFSR